jgi:DNA-binding NarL/FixJ family response regulator
MDLAADPRLKLILVDEHDAARTALVRRLAPHRQLVVAAETSDPGKALDIARDHAPHAALIDPVRSDGRGNAIVASFAQLAAARRPLVLVHLAYFDTQVWQRARDAGADDVILKLVDVDALASALVTQVVQRLPRDRWAAILVS